LARNKAPTVAFHCGEALDFRIERVVRQRVSSASVLLFSSRRWLEVLSPADSPSLKFPENHSLVCFGGVMIAH
jgi:hypothetical protein